MTLAGAIADLVQEVKRVPSLVTAQIGKWNGQVQSKIQELENWMTKNEKKLSQEKHLGKFELRAGNRYLDIKTNITSNSAMFYLRAKGYLYNRGFIDSTTYGYTYTDNSILNASSDNRSGNTLVSYRSKDGHLCFRIDSQTDGYSEGQIDLFFWSFSDNFRSGCEILSAVQNESETPYYQGGTE